MKRNISGLLMLAVLISIFSLAGCLNNNEARVTIHIQRNDLALQQKSEQKKFFIDRILEFFSSPAYGFIPQWSDSRLSMKLVVKSSSNGEKTYNLPDAATEYSVIIESDNNVTFTITSEGDDNSGTSTMRKMWGGEAIFDISAGEDKSISIQMKPMTWIISVGGSTDLFVSYMSTNMHSSVSNYYVYRSNNPNGLYSRITTVPTSTNPYTDSTAVSGITYYYKVSTNGTHGEGVKCDALSGSKL